MPAVNSLPPVLEGRAFATTAEAAGCLRIDARTVRRAITEGLIPATRTGRSYRIPVEWLRRELAKAER